MKTHLHFEDLNPTQVAAIMAAAHGAGAAGTGVALAPAAPAGATPPPPAAAPAAPPAAPVAPVAPPAPPVAPAAASPGSDPALIDQMQQHVRVHKAASLKHILGKLGIAKLTDANAAQAAWVKQVFDTGLPGPQACP